MSVEVLRTPDERFASLPGFGFEPHYVEIDGVRMHYLDEGPREGRPIVCFHGEPTWSYLYRKMVTPLTSVGYRVICPDFAGFGRSDKPTDPDWYTYDRHVATVSALLATLGLSDAVAVVQDWGGPIGLRWAVEHQPQVSALAILNTGLFSGRVSKGFMDWREFVERTPDLPIGFIIQGATTTELPDDVVAAYDAPFPSVEYKTGAQRFPMLVPIGDGQPGAAEMRAVRDALADWKTPVLVAFSDGDPVFPHPRSGEAFTDLIPNAGPQITIEGASHFLQEDRGEEIAAQIISFLAGVARGHA